ncbi:PilW family protein [Pseudorhodoferax soli]|uniref:Type IV pilus assembly protein PilW n=1 Tax=Pseudorhodoferax soli TaxID=545864 RepID=A0A368Y997_9BURK|nr:PilW family protein [Pseudorhodoferax soli]RCW76289.1 type IV pilus assembly protein PilW [Pseudorhodoferax soli]
MKPAARSSQAGVTLIELLVGLAIGLMAIAVALGALLVSRSVSGTVSDATQLQQQGAHAMRMIGLQLRQAGSIRLNLAFAQTGASAPTVIDPGEPVAFEAVFDRAAATLATDSTTPLQVGYQNYTEAVASGNGTVQRSLLGDCLGNTPSATAVQSNFRLVRAQGAATGELQCAGADGAAQTIIGNVTDFQVNYLVQTLTATGADMRRVAAAGVGGNWPSVVAVEVCLELVGTENIDTAGATYRNCSWTTGQAETAMGNRMRLVLRNTFQLRTQGAAR